MQRVTRRQVLQGVGAVGLALGAGCALPFAAPPPTANVRRVGFLSGAANPTFVTAAFRQGLSDLGYVEGRDLIIDERYANGDDQVAEPAADLVRLGPAAIVVPSVVVARAVQAETTTIPIVSMGGGDLVAAGLSTSHARSGGNVTGVTTPSLGGKRLQLLWEAVPGLSRVVYLFDTANPPRELRQEVESAATRLGVQVKVMGAGSAADLPAIFEVAVREHADGLFIALGPLITDNLTRIVELARQSRLPSMWAQSEAVGYGGLMAYGPNRADMARRAAGYVDKILKGAQPADLPVEEPMRFDFGINLMTAQALGLTIPQHVLLQATEVIQ